MTTIRSFIDDQASNITDTSEPKPNCSEKEEIIIITIPFKKNNLPIPPPGGISQKNSYNALAANLNTLTARPSIVVKSKSRNRLRSSASTTWSIIFNLVYVIITSILIIMMLRDLVLFNLIVHYD